MNDTDSNPSDPPSPMIDDSDSESPTASPTPRGPSTSEIPPNQHPVPPQRGMNGDGPVQHQTQVGRSLSNPASLAGQQGPSGAHHQVLAVPGMGGMAMTPAMVTSELNRIPPPSLTKLKQDLGMPDKDLTSMTPEEKMQLVTLFRRGTTTRRPPPIPRVEQNPSPTLDMLTAELNRISPPTLAKLKRKLGISGKDMAIMTAEEKTQLVELFRRGTMTSRNAPGPSTVPPGQQQQSVHPQMQPHGMVVQQGQLQGMHFGGPMAVPSYNSMLAHGSMTQQTNPMQHPMNPPAMQPGQGMVNRQIHQYRQAMQSIQNPPNMPRHVMPARAPSLAADGQGSHPCVLGLPNSRVDAPPPHHPASRIGGPGQGVPSATATPALVPRTPRASGTGTGMAAPPTPAISNHPPPPPPPGQSSNPPDFDPNMFSLNFTEFTDLDPAVLMGEGVDFERDFAAWFNPGPDRR